MSLFEYQIRHGKSLDECVKGVSSFSTCFGRLYVEGSDYYDGPMVASIKCSGDHGSGPISEEIVLLILDGAEPVVKWATDEDPANDYIHWHLDADGASGDAERSATLLAAQLTLCLAGLWPRCTQERS